MGAFKWADSNRQVETGRFEQIDSKGRLEGADQKRQIERGRLEQARQI